MKRLRVQLKTVEQLQRDGWKFSSMGKLQRTVDRSYMSVPTILMQYLGTPITVSVDSENRFTYVSSKSGLEAAFVVHNEMVFKVLEDLSDAEVPESKFNEDNVKVLWNSETGQMIWTTKEMSYYAKNITSPQWEDVTDKL